MDMYRPSLDPYMGMRLHTENPTHENTVIVDEMKESTNKPPMWQ